MTSPIKFQDYLYNSPKFTDIEARKEFNELSGTHQAATILLTIALGIFLFYPGYIAFRGLTHKFHEMEKKELEGSSKKTNDVASPVIIQEPIKKEDPKPTNPNPQSTTQTSEIKNSPTSSPLSEAGETKENPKADWQIFWENELRSILANQNKYFEEIKGDGDCLFSSISKHFPPEEKVTKQTLRQKVADHLKEANENNPKLAEAYRKLFVPTYVISYEEYCANIHKCTEEDIPIWGDRLALQVIADAYKLDIRFTNYRIELPTIDEDNTPKGLTNPEGSEDEETIESGEDEEIDYHATYVEYGEEDSVEENPFNLDSFLDDTNPSPVMPFDQTLLPKDIRSIELANISHDLVGWAHWVPVFHGTKIQD